MTLRTGVSSLPNAPPAGRGSESPKPGDPTFIGFG